MYEFDTTQKHPVTLTPGAEFGKGQNRAKILEVKKLSNGWVLLKIEGKKRPGDFRVRTVYQLEPTVRSLSPKVGHLALDFFGKLRGSQSLGDEVFRAIVAVWKGAEVKEQLATVREPVETTWGYPLEYVLSALVWIFDQEDVNFVGRSAEKQKELDELLLQSGIQPVEKRRGSQYALSLFCNIRQGKHPVDALLSSNLDILPAKRARGAT